MNTIQDIVFFVLKIRKVRSRLMKDAKKIKSISKLLGELQKSVNIINESAMAARPTDLPEDILWCENIDFEEIDPYVYTGDMSEVDFLKMQRLMGL